MMHRNPIVGHAPRCSKRSSRSFAKRLVVAAPPFTSARNGGSRFSFLCLHHINNSSNTSSYAPLRYPSDTKLTHSDFPRRAHMQAQRLISYDPPYSKFSMLPRKFCQRRYASNATSYNRSSLRRCRSSPSTLPSSPAASSTVPHVLAKRHARKYSSKQSNSTPSTPSSVSSKDSTTMLSPRVAVPAGIFAGSMGACTGLGGAVVLVPTLSTFTSFAPHMVAGTRYVT